MTEKRGGAREGSGRKKGENNKIMKSMRLAPDLVQRLKKVEQGKSFVEKIEEGILLFLEKYEK